MGNKGEEFFYLRGTDPHSKQFFNDLRLEVIDE